MEKNFEVGQVWRDRTKDLHTVTDITHGDDYPVKCFKDGEQSATYTLDGFHIVGCDDNEYDLVELVTNADGTPAASPLPLEATHELLTPGVDFVAGELKAFEPDARQAFIHGLIRDMAVTAIENGLTFSDVEDGVRGAVNLRDALLKKSD